MKKFLAMVAIGAFLATFLTACGGDDAKKEAASDSAPVVESRASAPVAESKNSTQVADSVSSTPTAQNTEVNPAELYKKCASCHGEKGERVAPGSVGNVLISKLSEKQIKESLLGFRAGTLSKGGNSTIMYMQTKRLSDTDIAALAKYISNFK